MSHYIKMFLVLEMVYNKMCAVVGCNENVETQKLHRFPMDNSRTIEWIALSGNPRLLNMERKQLHNNVRVSNKHFAEVDVYASERLSKLAKPVLHLPSK